MTMEKQRYDVVVIGSGVGGLAAARAIAQFGGKRVLLPTVRKPTWACPATSCTPRLSSPKVAGRRARNVRTPWPSRRLACQTLPTADLVISQ